MKGIKKRFKSYRRVADARICNISLIYLTREGNKYENYRLILDLSNDDDIFELAYNKLRQQRLINKNVKKYNITSIYDRTKNRFYNQKEN